MFIIVAGMAYAGTLNRDLKMFLYQLGSYINSGSFGNSRHQNCHWRVDVENLQYGAPGPSVWVDYRSINDVVKKQLLTGIRGYFYQNFPIR